MLAQLGQQSALKIISPRLTLLQHPIKIIVVIKQWFFRHEVSLLLYLRSKRKHFLQTESALISLIEQIFKSFSYEIMLKTL